MSKLDLEKAEESEIKFKTSVGSSKKRTEFQENTYLCFIGEEAMVPHSSTLAWRIPGTGEPGGLPSMGSHRVGHD